jgi:O-antigen/teichoic acid export membrane protein
MKRLFNNTAFTTLDYFVLIVLNLLATPILIKNFGIEGYGAFVFLSIFSIYGALNFFDLGMEGALMNYVSRFEADTNRRKLQDTLSISLVYYAALGILVGTLTYFSGDFITSRLVDDSAILNRAAVTTSITIISVNIFLQFLTLPFAAILQGLRRFVITKSVNSIITVFRYLLIIIAAVYFHRIELAFMIITGLSVINLAVFLYIFMFKMPQFRPMKIRFDFPLLRTLFTYSSVLFVSRIIGLICNQVDKVLIWLYLAVTSLAIYDVIARPANMLRLTITIVNSAIIPEVARLHHMNDLAAIRKLYINLVRYAYLVLMPILVLLYVYIGDLLYLWVGENFVPYAYMAMILFSAYLIQPIPSIASTMLVGMEKVKQTLWIPITFTVINVVLSIVLLRAIGLAGLLVATLCAEVFAVLPYLYAMRKFLDSSMRGLSPALLRIAMTAAPMLVAHYAVRSLLQGQIAVIIAMTGTIFLFHIYINYHYLLADNEKTFLMDRFKVFRARIATGVPNR